MIVLVLVLVVVVVVVVHPNFIILGYSGCKTQKKKRPLGFYGGHCIRRFVVGSGNGHPRNHQDVVPFGPPFHLMQSFCGI